MSGGILGVAGDILSVAFLCFICSLAIQLYCAFRRRTTTRPPPPLPATISSPLPQPPTAASKQLYLSRFQRSASCPVVSAIAPPASPPNRLSSAYHIRPMGCGSPSNVSPLACTSASQAHIADLAKLMQLERGEEQDVDVENFVCMPPQRQLFTIKEEGKDEDAAEQSNGASGSGTDWDSERSCQVLEKEKQAKCTSTATCAPAGLVSQVSSASSEGGVSLWSTSPCPSSPAVSYLSASSSPFPSTSSPPRASFWAQSSRFSNPPN